MAVSTQKLEESQNFLREVIFIVFYRKAFIRTVTLAVAAVFLVIALVLPSYYKSEAKFSVSMPQSMDPMQKETSYDTKNQYVRLLFDQKEIIFSNRVLMKVAAYLSPEGSEREHEKIIERLRKDITVAPPKDQSFEATNFYYVTYASKDPQRSLEILNFITSSYLQVYTDIIKQRSEFSYDFYKDQVEGLNTLVQQKADALQNFEVQHATSLVDILNLEPGKNNAESGAKALLTETRRRQQGLIEEYSSLTNTIAELEKDLASNASLPLLPDMEGSGRAITAYKSKASQLEMQFNEMKTQFTMSYEPMRRLKSELDATNALLKNEIGTYVRAKKIQAAGIKASLDELERQLTDLENSVRDTAEQKAVHDRLKNDLQLARDNYVDVRSKLEQARLANSLPQQKLVITQVDKPTVPSSPFKPNRLAIVILGLVLGLFAGLAGAFTMDYFDHSIKNPEDIVRHLRLPCFGSISAIAPE